MSKRSAFSLYSERSSQEVCEVANVKHQGRQCSECGAQNTPQWRQGPSGPQTLCNACGVRYSRLTRRVKTPKRSSHDFAASPQDDLDDIMLDSGSEDTSKGTILMTSTPTGSPRSTPVHSPVAALVTHVSHQASSPLRPIRAVRTGSGHLSVRTGSGRLDLGPLTTQPGSPRASTTPHTSRRSSSGTTLVPPAKQLEQPLPGAPEEEDMDCEAAMNLLSMAAGAPCQDSSPQLDTQPGAPDVKSNPAGSGSSEASLEAVRPHSGVLSAVRSGALASGVQPGELRALQGLCAAFDQRFKDLVAARAACEAVSRVLEQAQATAQNAQAAARAAAKALMVHARDLSSQEAVMQAIASAAAQAADGVEAPEEPVTCTSSTATVAPVTLL